MVHWTLDRHVAAAHDARRGTGRCQMDEDFDAIIAGTWVMSSVPAALLGGIVVTVATMDLVVGVIAALAGLIMALVVAFAVTVVGHVRDLLAFDVYTPDLSDRDRRVGRGLKMRRRLGVGDVISEALTWLAVLVMFFGPAVAALVTPIIVGFPLSS